MARHAGPGGAACRYAGETVASPLVTILTWIRREEQRVVPWRNGGGSTREVALEPSDGSLERGFDWRVSCAGVAADGPFSPFPGFDRSLWLVRGAGVRLELPGRTVELMAPWQRIDFAGELPVVARLLAGPVDDLNVMVRRGVVRAAATVEALAEGDRRRLAFGPGEHLLLALAGPLAVLGGVLGSGDAVRWRGELAGELLALDGAAVWLQATFERP